MDNFSIVIPVYNEEESIIDLIIEIYNALENCNSEYEIIVVDDCSNDNTFKKLKSNIDKYKIKYLYNSKNNGQSFSIHY